MAKRLSSDFFTNNVWMANVICLMMIIDHNEDFGYLDEYKYICINVLCL